MKIAKLSHLDLDTAMGRLNKLRIPKVDFGKIINISLCLSKILAKNKQTHAKTIGVKSLVFATIPVEA